MNKIFSLILILSISSCSSIAFWQSDEIDLDEPRELKEFNERFEFIEIWDIKFNIKRVISLYPQMILHRILDLKCYF